MFYPLARRILFSQDAEVAHDLTINMLAKVGHSPLKLALGLGNCGNARQVMGLNFPNPVGLAAGLDKNGECIDAWFAMGFGFIELGTVTPRPQPGNDKPRLFRIPEAEAIINRMGFNNKGVDYLVEKVQQVKQRRGIIGINIGKNRDTPVEQGKQDYLTCLEKVYPHADYVTINISSPNTPGLRTLQHGEALDELLAALKQKQQELCGQTGCYVPLAVKIAPDMDDEQIQQTAASLIKHQIDGVIATNTTLSRAYVENFANSQEQGGLSGKPLFPASTEFLQKLAKALEEKLPIIGVGGIDSVKTAEAKLAAGADLVQIYSGLIYQGPGLVNQLKKAL